MTSLLILGLGLGFALLAFGLLEREPLPIGAGVGLLLLCVVPQFSFPILMGVVAVYFLFFILIGYWL